jgi:hypothetical protein
LPDLIGNVTGTINNVVALNKAKLEAAQQARRVVANPPKGISQTPVNPVNPADNPVYPKEATPQANTDQSSLDGQIPEKEEDKVNFLIMMFANQLNGWVTKGEHTPEIFDKITNATLKLTDGKPVIQDALKQGTMTSKDLAKMIMDDLDKLNYKTPETEKQLLDYCEAYKAYICKDIEKNPLFIVECNICGQQYNFDSQAEFDNLSRSEQFCDGEEGAPCNGELFPLNTTTESETE